MDKSIIFRVTYTIAVLKFKLHQGQIHGVFALFDVPFTSVRFSSLQFASVRFSSLQFASVRSCSYASLFRFQCAHSLGVKDLVQLPNTRTVRYGHNSLSLCTVVFGKL